jgi:PilZ domain-containing protein
MSEPEAKDGKEAGLKIIARALKDRRRFRRVQLAITGRLYIPGTEEETNCTVEDISPGGVSVSCELQREPKGQVIIYFDKLGRFEGPIARVRHGSFAIRFSCSAQRREKLADRLTLELNRHLLTGTDLRRFGRTKATSPTSAHFTRFTGERVACEMIDLSPTGVSLRTKVKPAVGEHLLIGNRAARVVRHHPEGIAIEYLGSAPDAGPMDKRAPVSAPVARIAAVAAATR